MMTENKRFGVTDHRDNPYLCDWNVTDYADGGIVHMPMTSENMANEICDLLNDLSEENEQLKSELSETKEILHSIEKDRNQTLLICKKYEGFFKEKGYDIQDLIDYVRDGSND